ncbi:MAG: ABC transporter ATP-binding protein [Fervidobacterium sp.]|uniref:ABC transporter ATP-binding protein n=1 Tax=Fervidobacterium TaxID=2422 RepID=UPI002204B90E|nr:ABC transporter [Fervidobacterium riparium]
MLILERITKRFESKLALDKIEGRVEVGEVVAVIGENGSGKSTLLNILGTFLKPTEGKLYYNNIDVFGSPESINEYRKLVTYVSENSQFISELNLKDNLNYFKYVFKSEKDINSISEQVGIEKFLSQRPARLSKGQRQRLSLAISLLKDASVILLDEPAEGLDVETKAVVKNIVKSFKDKGCIVFYVTHDEDEVEEVCDKILVLKNGKTTFFGNVDEFWNKYEKFYSVTYYEGAKKTTKVVNIDELRSIQENRKVSHIRNLGLREIINLSEELVKK